MSLRNLVDRKLVSCVPSTPVLEVARLMDDENVGAILVLQDSKPLGIVTDRDIVLRCVVEGMDCRNQPVSDIMTDTVRTVTVNEGIYDIIKLMKEEEIRRVPVVDDFGNAVGLVSFGDMMALLGKEIHDLAVPATPEEPKIVESAA
jgi:signal-transduction protein with cAMP-binding, CBS, and nucleotidyltransferase domain